MTEKIVKTDQEWREQLTDLEYHVMRKKGTERPHSHDDFPDAPGIYRCKGCGAVLFEADSKFNAHCGWPSFDAPAQGAVIDEKRDVSHGMIRTEVLCATCDSHLGHVFPDGPTATGLRYCINGVAIDFDPED